ncbi:unnamed protein product, partial [Didymodactylos carnosus]
LHRYRDLKRNWSKTTGISGEQNNILQSLSTSTENKILSNHPRYPLPYIVQRKKCRPFKANEKLTKITETKSFFQNDDSTHKLSTTTAEYLTTTNEKKNRIKSSTITVTTAAHDSYLKAKQIYEQQQQQQQQQQQEQTRKQEGIVVKKSYCLNDYINDDRNEINLEPLHVRIQQDLIKLRKLIKARQRRAEREREKKLQVKLKLINTNRVNTPNTSKHLSIEQILSKLQEEYDNVPQIAANEQACSDIEKIRNFDCQPKSKLLTTISDKPTTVSPLDTVHVSGFKKMKHFLAQEQQKQLNSDLQLQQQQQQQQRSSTSTESQILPTVESGIGSSISSQCSQYNNKKIVTQTIHQKEYRTSLDIKFRDINEFKNKKQQKNTIKQPKSQPSRSIFNIQNSRVNTVQSVLPPPPPPLQQRRSFICSVTLDEDEDEDESESSDEENEDDTDETNSSKHPVLHLASKKNYEKSATTIIHYTPRDITRMNTEKNLHNYHCHEQQQNSNDDIQFKLQRSKTKLKLSQQSPKSKRTENRTPNHKISRISVKSGDEFNSNGGGDDDDCSTAEFCRSHYTYAGSTSKNQVKNNRINTKTSSLLHILFASSSCIQEEGKEEIEYLL